MRYLFLIALLLVTAGPVSADCTVVEYEDHNEVVCEGEPPKPLTEAEKQAEQRAQQAEARKQEIEKKKLENEAKAREVEERKAQRDEEDRKRKEAQAQAARNKPTPNNSGRATNMPIKGLDGLKPF